MTGKNSYCLMGLLLLFTLFVTIPYACTYVPVYGLFGELKTAAVVNENREESAEVSSKLTVRKKQKGENKFNVWFFISADIACLRLLAHDINLPKTDTIVAKKVRMNH